MSKIRSKSIAPRKKQGLLEIGEEGSTTQFHPASTVIIPGYATDERIDGILAGDVSLEGVLTKEEAASVYQALREKGAPDGYVPLSSVGKIPNEYLSVTGFDIVGTYGTGKPLPDPEGLEDGSAFICDTDNYDDQYLPGKTSHSGDIALDIGESYDLIPSTGTVSADQVVETENRVFVHPEDEENLKDYIDDADKLIKDTYLPLKGGTDHKMTGDIYMQQHHIKGIADDPDNAQDAVNQKYVDAASDDKVSKSGDTMTGNLVMNDNQITVDTIELTGNRKIDVEDGFGGYLNYDGENKMGWGNQVSLYADLNLRNHKIINLPDPVAGDDPATKDYVDANSGGGGGGPSPLGRLFKFRSSGTDHFRLNVGEFQMTTANNAAWTGTPSNAAFLSFNYEDLDGTDWRVGAQGNYSMPGGFIQVYSDTSMLGWWLYESEANANWSFTDYSAGGGVILPVKAWVPTSSTSTFPSNGEFRLHAPHWG